MNFRRSGEIHGVMKGNSYLCHSLSFVMKLGCRVVSPLVVLYCLQQQHCVPKAEKPVYNMAMADITVSCTSLDKATRVSLLHLFLCGLLLYLNQQSKKNA